jgi:spore maturation protein CgeB
MLARLADEGLGVRVWSWDKGWLAFRRPNLVLTPHFVSDGQYRKAISGAKINVGFLRKVNRDLQTTRSVEIPACGGFLLAERTEEHNRLFAEGSEAEYFGDYDELINKVRRFLEDNSARRRISAAGYKRCLQGSYSNRERLAPIVARMFAATNQ